MIKKSLAVKYRPMKFDDVVEQGVTVNILKQQIEDMSFGHAYLFSGTTGCGKTTCARIFAREINAEVVEIDAASHTGIDDVRLIIESAQRKSVMNEYKLFILDECHSFSSKAWQAMLKLLEDTPSTTVIVLCTTDVQKVPLTILNRVQRLEFTQVTLKGIVERLEIICDNEGIDYKEGALYYIAGLSKGSVRTAISLLEKACATNGELTGENVVKQLGVVDYDTYFKLLNCTDTFNNEGAITILEEQRKLGKDIKVVMENFTKFVLDCMKIKICQKWEVSDLPYIDRYVDLLRDEDKDEILSTLRFCKACLYQFTVSNSDPLNDVEVLLLLRGVIK